MKEDNGRFIITGIVEEVQNKTLESNIYTNVYNGASGGFMQ